MLDPPCCVLTINCGSSSIRFALYELREANALKLQLSGKIDRIGLSGTNLVVNYATGEPQTTYSLPSADHRVAANFLLEWFDEQSFFGLIVAIGHRVVHGMQHSDPEQITPVLLDELHRITPYAPGHLPQEISLIEAFQQRFPDLCQVACFDTAFHRTMPRIARLLPIPRRYRKNGIERYGFHGLSYACLMQALGDIDSVAAKGRVILAHLGNGASLAAVSDGRSIDTSMGFTPAAGLVMSTRSGDMDPGVMAYLMQTEHMAGAELQHMVNHESGLLGISETSPDMRDLLALEATDVRAADAVALFCYQVKKWIGSFSAALGGIDTLVFAGGIGENLPLIRARICEGLGFLGIDLNVSRNDVNAAVISTDTGRVMVRVIHADEELMIARSVVSILDQGSIQ